MNKNLIVVYGSLRKGMGNHGLIQHSEFLGTFNSEPVYSLYSLGGFPGLKEDGNTSVVMEVYEVDDNTATRVDILEGYKKGGDNFFYDKKKIQTPFGEASVYTYIPDVTNRTKVESGNWTEYVNQRNTQWV